MAEEGFRRLFINRGKRDHFFAREIINIVNRYVKGKVEIGRIDLLPTIAFFEVPEEDAEEVIRMMAKAKVGDRRVVVDWADREDAPDAVSRTSRRPKSKARADVRQRRNATVDHTERPQRGRKERPVREAHAPASKTGRKGRKYSKDDWKQFFDK